MALLFDRLRYGGRNHSKQPGDSSDARAQMAVLHMLVANGARWMPKDKQAISDVRRSLLKLVPAFTMEFAWLMKHYGAARRTDVSELLSAPSMRRHLSNERPGPERTLAAIPEEVTPYETGPGETHTQQEA